MGREAREIAGHLFVDGPNGCRCVRYTSVYGEDVCNKALVDIMGATEDDIDKGNTGLAHSGPLTRYKFEQIRAEVERQHVARLWSSSCG